MPQSVKIPARSSAKTNYPKLLSAVRSEVARGLLEAEKALEQKRLEAYWRIGKKIHNYFYHPNTTRFQKATVYDRLSEDLNLARDLLTRMVRFYKLYPRFTKNPQLTWTHYQSLMRIPDASRRNRLYEKVIREGISSLRLKTIVTEINTPQKRQTPGTRLRVARGIPYVYRVRAVDHFHVQKALCEIDCGFHIHIDKPSGVGIKLIRGQIVRSEKDRGSYRLAITTLSRDCLYTYKAYIERVIDADTIKVKVDCGFGIRLRQTIRLRSVNSPELATVKGRQARAFVEGAVKDLAFVVIKTYGSEKYGRYLADIFILPGCDDAVEVAAKGRLLNQMLLDEGLAEVYK